MKNFFRSGVCLALISYVFTYLQTGWAAEASARALTKLHNLPPNHAARLESLIQEVIGTTLKQQYDLALALADSAIKLAPDEPAGHLFRVAILQSRMLDYGRLEDEKSFFKSTAECRKLAQKKLAHNPKDAWAQFFLGGALGYEAFFLGKKKRFFEAFRTGWQCIQHLEAAVKYDPQLYDAYLGIGTYKYYRSKLSKNFAWLPFVEDERQEGISMVRQAMAKGRYSRSAAINGLCWILMDENRPAEVLALVDSALAIYPSNRFFLWAAAAAAYRTEHYQKASAYYRQILQSLENENQLSPYIELVGRTRLAKAYRADKQMEAACQELQRIGELKLSKEERSRGKEFLEEAARYGKNCQGPANEKAVKRL